MRRVKYAMLTVLFALAVPLSGVATAAPAEPDVQIMAQADLGPGFIEVELTAVCLPDAGANGVIFVKARQAETNAFGESFPTIPCDGQRHQVTTFLFGPWAPGDALADAVLAVFTPTGQFPSDREYKVLHIQ
jgi:hypothetical protein